MATVAAPAAEFAGVFGDRMVLQRDQPIAVWGTAAPRQPVTVTLADAVHSAETDAAGRWKVVFPAMSAGGPYELRLQDSGGSERTIEDVLVGDLWLCSGQSNMAYPVARSSGNHGEAAHDAIRLLTVQRDSDPLPRSEFTQAPEWRHADGDSIPEFSAVCFFFARELQQAQPVPLGLIHSSWGGSEIEAWMSAAALERAGGFDRQLELLRSYAREPQVATEQFGADWEEWWRKTVPAPDSPWKQSARNPAAKDAAEWDPAPGLQDWKAFGDPALENHNGMVWFRNSFELGAERANRDALLSLGGIDEVDLVWINGRFIGTGFGWGTERSYKVPPGLLRAGRNQLALNVLSTWGSGGMLGPQEQMQLTFADGESVSLGSGWQYRRVASEPGLPPRAPWLSIGGIAGLFNAMVAPLQDLQIAGALWYQGESNADHAATYANLLTEMIADWRRRFGASLPFLIVQLPNFGALPLAPSESGWAAIRDAQRRVACDDPYTGLVVTADVGDPLDLHPPNKEIVGRRAASVARALVYGGEGIIDGLSPSRAIRSGNEVMVEFDPAVDRLIVVGDSKPVAFELCTDEPSSCVYADARLEENRVYLTAPDAADATRVRFCWADAPVCNLYGASGLPVGSFEYPLPARESLQRSAGRIAIDTIEAPSLRDNPVGDSSSRKVLVYLPPGYEETPDAHYPAIYLLHSYGADPESWLGRNGYEGMHVGKVLDALIVSGEIRPLIVVMPDAKNRFGGSWYTDSASTGNWESFIADDLVSMVDGKYRTLARREGRGIAGQSMGAYGDLRRVHIRLEAGDRDPAIAEARAFAGALRDHDVPFSLETFEGGHVEGIRRRFETAAFAFFDRFFREAENEAAEEGPYQ